MSQYTFFGTNESVYFIGKLLISNKRKRKKQIIVFFFFFLWSQTTVCKILFFVIAMLSYPIKLKKNHPNNHEEKIKSPYNIYKNNARCIFQKKSWIIKIRQYNTDKLKDNKHTFHIFDKDVIFHYFRGLF